MLFPPTSPAASILRLIAQERDRWILWTAVFLGAGIGLYFALPSEPPTWAGLAGVAGAGLCLAWQRSRRGFVVAVMLVIVAVGFGAAQLRTHLVAEPVLAKRLGPVKITGVVVAFERMEIGSRVTLERLQVARLRPDRIPKQVRVRLRGRQPVIEPGAWLSLRAVLSPPPAPAAPGAFDFQRQSYFKGLGAVGFAYGRAEVIAQPSLSGVAALWPTINRFRTALQTRVTGYLGGERGAVAAALMMGERRAISASTMDNIRESGLAHLLAISGLHIGLVAGIVFVGLRAVLALIRPLALGFPIKKWAAVAALAAAFFFALVAGGTLPTQRAFLMIAAVFIGMLLDREGVTMRLVAFAAILILLVRPESLLSASFQMSFAAVIGLVAVYEAQMRPGAPHDGGLAAGLGAGATQAAGRKNRYGPRFGPFRYLVGVAAASVIATLATAPFVAHHFNQIAVYGVVANLVAVPVTALWVMPWAVVAFALYPFELDGVALTAMGWGVQVVLDVAANIAPLPGAVARFPALPLPGLVMAALGGLWLCLWRGRWRYWGGLGLVFAVALAGFTPPPDILVDGSGRLIGLRGPTGDMAVSTRRAAKFTRNVWLRRAGLAQAGLDWPKPGVQTAQTAAFIATAKSGDRRSLARSGTSQPTGRTAKGAVASDGAGQGVAVAGLDLRCDSLGCVYRPASAEPIGGAVPGRGVGHSVALVSNPLALSEDCARASVIIATVAVPRWCRTPQIVIDRWDLWRNGTHALWFGSGGDVRVRSVAQARGTRPWVVQPGAGASSK